LDVTLGLPDRHRNYGTQERSVPSRKGCVPAAPDDGHKIHAGAAFDPVPDAGAAPGPLPDAVTADPARVFDAPTPPAEVVLATPGVAVDDAVPTPVAEVALDAPGVAVDAAAPTPVAEVAPGVAVDVGVLAAAAADDTVCAAAGPASTIKNASAMRARAAGVGLSIGRPAIRRRLSTKRGGPDIGLPSASSFDSLMH
jgi:hypothetical protein